MGVNTIDLEAASAAGIAVCNMPGTNSRAVAEMTLLLMLSTLRRLPQSDALCRSGEATPKRIQAFLDLGVDVDATIDADLIALNLVKDENNDGKPDHERGPASALC